MRHFLSQPLILLDVAAAPLPTLVRAIAKKRLSASSCPLDPMFGGRGWGSELDSNLTFDHSHQPPSLQLLGYLSPSPRSSQVIALTQGAKDQQTKVNFFTPVRLGEGEARLPKESPKGRLEAV